MYLTRAEIFTDEIMFLSFINNVFSHFHWLPACNRHRRSQPYIEQYQDLWVWALLEIFWRMFAQNMFFQLKPEKDPLIWIRCWGSGSHNFRGKEMEKIMLFFEFVPRGASIRWPDWGSLQWLNMNTCLLFSQVADTTRSGNNPQECDTVPHQREHSGGVKFN